MGEHDPVGAQFAEVCAQGLVVEVAADRPVEGVGLDGEQNDIRRGGRCVPSGLGR